MRPLHDATAAIAVRPDAEPLAPWIGDATPVAECALRLPGTPA